jgi:hypothetical protein
VTARRIGARALVLCLGLCLLATACRAPGEPPSHPDKGVYRDIIRREADSTRTALATVSLLIGTARRDGLPATYARVTLRSMVGDLQHVVTDLGEIDPPRTAARPQRRLRAIAAQDAVLFARLQQHWSDRALQGQVLRQATRQGHELDTSLEDQLQR